LTNINQNSPTNINVKKNTYDSLRLLQELNPNGTTTSYAYDDLIRVTSLKNTTTSPAPYTQINYNYTYDPLSNITSDGRDSFQYDKTSQIITTNYNV
jgi:YD repeat-containing protein